MGYALQTLWHEKTRYASGVLAVTFSAVLIALQCGLLLGLFKITSIPIDNTRADIWVGSTAVLSVDLGEPIPISHIARLDKPGVQMPEYMYLPTSPTGPSRRAAPSCASSSAAASSRTRSGRPTCSPPSMRTALTEPMTVIVDESDLKRLGLEGSTTKPKINGKEVRLVGTVNGLGAWPPRGCSAR